MWRLYNTRIYITKTHRNSLKTYTHMLTYFIHTYSDSVISMDIEIRGTTPLGTFCRYKYKKVVFLYKLFDVVDK